MTKSQKQWWEQERAQGQGRFILRVGIMRRGLPFGILVAIGSQLIAYFRSKPVDPLWEIAMQCGLYTLAFGLVMGLTLWNANERDFKKDADDDDMA